MLHLLSTSLSQSQCTKAATSRVAAFVCFLKTKQGADLEYQHGDQVSTENLPENGGKRPLETVHLLTDGGDGSDTGDIE